MAACMAVDELAGAFVPKAVVTVTGSRGSPEKAPSRSSFRWAAAGCVVIASCGVSSIVSAALNVLDASRSRKDVAWAPGRVRALTSYSPCLLHPTPQ